MWEKKEIEIVKTPSLPNSQNHNSTKQAPRIGETSLPVVLKYPKEADKQSKIPIKLLLNLAISKTSWGKRVLRVKRRDKPHLAAISVAEIPYTNYSVFLLFMQDRPRLRGKIAKRDG